MWKEDERIPCHFESWRFTTISELCFSAGGSGRRIRRLSGPEPRQRAPGMADNFLNSVFLKITSHPSESLLVSALKSIIKSFFFVWKVPIIILQVIHTSIWKCWKRYYCTNHFECGCIILVDYFWMWKSRKHIQMENSNNCGINNFWTGKWPNPLKQFIRVEKVRKKVRTICKNHLCLHVVLNRIKNHQWMWGVLTTIVADLDPIVYPHTQCSAQTRTGIGLLGKPPAVKQFPSDESHLGVRAS